MYIKGFKTLIIFSASDSKNRGFCSVINIKQKKKESKWVWQRKSRSSWIPSDIITRAYSQNSRQFTPTHWRTKSAPKSTFRQRTSRKSIQSSKNKQVCTVVMFYTSWGTKNLDFKCLWIGYLEEFESGGLLYLI